MKWLSAARPSGSNKYAAIIRGFTRITITDHLSELWFMGTEVDPLK